MLSVVAMTEIMDPAAVLEELRQVTQQTLTTQAVPQAQADHQTPRLLLACHPLGQLSPYLMQGRPPHQEATLVVTDGDIAEHTVY
jgi:hypothetical protein